MHASSVLLGWSCVTQMYIHAYSFCIYTLSLDYSVPVCLYAWHFTSSPYVQLCCFQLLCPCIFLFLFCTPVLLSVNASFFFFPLFSCCTALCYRCFQLVCAWHPAVYCPEPPFLHARPLPPPVYINRSLMLSGNGHASQLSPSTYELGHLDPHCLINAPEG